MRVAEDVDREFATGPYSRPYRGVKFKGYETHTSYFDKPHDRGLTMGLTDGFHQFQHSRC